jgi:hypothetical protein
MSPASTPAHARRPDLPPSVPSLRPAHRHAQGLGPGPSGIAALPLLPATRSPVEPPRHSATLPPHEPASPSRPAVLAVPVPAPPCRPRHGAGRLDHRASALVDLVALHAPRRDHRKQHRQPDPQTPDDALTAYRAVTLVWFPVQIILLALMLWYVPQASHLAPGEKIALFFGMGVSRAPSASTTPRADAPEIHGWNAGWPTSCWRRCCIRHFRTEHLRVHHTHVGTPRDAVTARYNEGFHRFFPRVLRQCPQSAWRAEAAMLARKGEPVWHRSNPFWRYGLLQGRAGAGPRADPRRLARLGPVPRSRPSPRSGSWS